MAAGVCNLYIDQGTTYKHRFVVKNHEHVPMILTNFKVRMQIRDTRDVTEILVQYTTENAHILVNGPLGEITIVVPSAETTVYDWDRGSYDLEIESPSGDVTRLLKGIVTCSREVTR